MRRRGYAISHLAVNHRPYLCYGYILDIMQYRYYALHILCNICDLALGEFGTFIIFFEIKTHILLYIALYLYRMS